MMRFAWRLAVVLPVVVLTSALAQAQIVVPSGFTDSQVTPINSPTDLGFLPDGRMLITTQGGALRVWCPSAALPGCSAANLNGLLNAAALNLGSAVCTDSERGLLGVAVDPAFGAGNTDIFLYYTANKAGVGCKNRVSRFVYNPANNTVGAEAVLVDNMLSTAGNHNAGDVKFGKDGYLYITIGDGGCDYVAPNGCQDGNFAARDEQTLTGKVLRITRTGGIPPTNPWAGTGDRCNVTGGTTAGRRCQETFSWGHRNPFRFAFDPNDPGTRFFINEVGGGAYEEINEGMAGQDFGWSCREGKHTRNTASRTPSSHECSPTPPNMVDPIFEYSHSGNVPGTTVGGCTSITGGAFVPNGVWPAAYDNKFLFADYVCGAMFQMGALAPYATNAAIFGDNFGGSSITSLRFGPFQGTQALYYTTYGDGVHRIIYSFPKAVASSDVAGGPTAPVTVTFSGAGSTDPNGLALSYIWDFGDGGGPQAPTASVTTPHTYVTTGTFTATLRVRNTNNQTSDPATLVISIGTPPTATIQAPAATDKFRVGQTVTLMGFGKNSAGAFLPAANLEWTVLLHHDAHTHPFFGPQVGAACAAPNATSSCVTITTPQPEDFAAAATSYLEIHLKATDGNGLITTLPTQNFQANRVTLNFTTEPPGLPLQLAGAVYATPLAATSWENYAITAQVNPQPQPNGQTYVFSAWADGSGLNPRTITTPAATASYVARFRDDGTHRRTFYTLTPCRLIDTRGTAGVPIGGPALASGSTRTFVLTGKCGIPAGIRAVAANLTVVSPTLAGDLRLFPTGGTGNTSNINFQANQTRANNAAISLDATGQLSLTCAMSGTGTTHFLLDVVGYFQ